MLLQFLGLKGLDFCQNKLDQFFYSEEEEQDQPMNFSDESKIECVSYSFTGE